MSQPATTNAIPPVTARPAGTSIGEFVLFLGLCPALAVSSRLNAALWMCLAILAVLLLSTLAGVLLGLLAPGRQGRARWFVSLVVTAGAVTAVQALLGAIAPEAVGSLGFYLPVLAVNCLITCRTELAVRGEPAGKALLGSLSAGAALAACILVIAAVRELLGFGTLTLPTAGGFGSTLVVGPLAAAPLRIAGLACGGFIVAGYLAAAVAGLRNLGSRGGRR
jgi:Na+-translocating ferredoxin:NAD+ oxidoreductase subunit E